ncbi:MULTISPECIES: IclR family transcriptional regulator [Priestia]|uniref:IclR family transcriptional regulator n=1 Tax=Priestia TaxID=2800373 RepID=UPI002040D461|nr:MULTISPECIES: IclR family transcriptional regulator [Priestia]MCM3771397.1 IclR family transcriptional regulator [Priestia aryabhattai]MDY0943843.1 IclR family transcriptional regulator [Priestia megaterium]
MNGNEAVKGIRTVQRSINVMNCFTFEEHELSLTEISQKINLAKSTTSRLLDTLVQNGFIQKKSSNLKYTLGYKMREFGRIAERSVSVEVIEIAKPFMKKLRNETGESVSLFMLENKKRVCIKRYSSKQSISHVVNVGETLPLEIGAGGKVLLAFQPDSYIESILKEINSKELLNRLSKELSLIRKEYISTSIDERGAGVNTISSPIYDINGRVDFCLCVSGPSTRFTLEVMNSLKSKVKENALKISEYIKDQNLNV